MAVPAAQKFQLFTRALSGIIIIFMPDNESKYRTVGLNAEHMP